MKTEHVVRFGGAAHGNRGHYAGRKVHRLVCERIVELTPEEIAEYRDKRRNLVADFIRDFESGSKREHYLNVRPSCGVTSGQWAGAVSPSYSAADVTCEKCLKVLERVAAWGTR